LPRTSCGEEDTSQCHFASWIGVAVNGFEILKPMVNTPGDIWSDRHAYQSSDANAYQSNNSTAEKAFTASQTKSSALHRQNSPTS